MRNVRHSGEAGVSPLIAGSFLEFERAEVSDADLKLIDSFADLSKAKQKTVLEKTGRMLQCDKPNRTHYK